MAGMTGREIHLLVEDYIGTVDGYLKHFSYSTHDAFYHRYCDLDIDVPLQRSRFGSTRKTFIGILKEASPRDQAKIIKGVFEVLPPPTTVDAETSNQIKLHTDLVRVAERLEAGGAVEVPALAISSDTIMQLLKDAEVLLGSRGASSAIDRAHTALHAYLKKVCSDRGAVVPNDPSITALFKVLREQFIEFKSIVAHDDEARRLFGSVATALDSINTIRNRGSRAHPNELILDGPEAMLYINLSRAVLGYLDGKLKKSP